MRITMERTEDILELDGVPVRRWQGTLESGAPVHVYVHRLASSAPQAQLELEAAGHHELEAPSNMQPIVTWHDAGMVQAGMALGHELASPRFAEERAAIAADPELARQLAAHIAHMALRAAADPDRSPESDQRILSFTLGAIRQIVRQAKASSGAPS